MTEQKQTNQEIVQSLVHNYRFKRTNYDSLPTIDFVYPNFVQDCNREDFRFSSEIRRELAKGKSDVQESLRDKEVVWTRDNSLVMLADNVVPRVGLGELINGKINSIYSLYAPMLFLGFGKDKNDFVAYPVKAIPLDYRIGGQMFWYQLTEGETSSLYSDLIGKAEEKPYKTLSDKLMGLFWRKEK